MRKLRKKQGVAPDVLVTDNLPSYGAEKREPGFSAHQKQGLPRNDRAETSDQAVRRRERMIQPRQVARFSPAPSLPR